MYKNQGSEIKYDDLLKMRYEDFCSELGDDGCYGLGIEINRRLRKILPDYRLLALGVANQDKIEQFRTGFEKTSSPEPGDMVLIRKMDMDGYHIGVVIEAGYFLQATQDHGISRIRMNHPFVENRIEGIYRYVGF